MSVQKIACASCGASIGVPADVDRLTCAYCGTAMVVQRGEGYVALKLAEQVSRTIQEVGTKTQATIQQSAAATQAELRRLEQSQQLSATEMQLNDIQAEIRALQRQKLDRQGKAQMKELRMGEAALLSRARSLNAALAPASGGQDGLAGRNQYVGGVGAKSWNTTALLAFFLGAFGAHRFYTGYTVIGLIQLFTIGGCGVWWIIDIILLMTNRYRDANHNPLAGTPSGIVRSLLPACVAFWVVTVPASQVLGEYAVWAALVIAAAVFVCGLTWRAAFWDPVRRLFKKGG